MSMCMFVTHLLTAGVVLAGGCGFPQFRLQTSHHYTCNDDNGRDITQGKSDISANELFMSCGMYVYMYGPTELCKDKP